MRILIDVRVLGRDRKAGIPIYIKELTSRLIAAADHQFELFYPGLRKQPLPADWLVRKNVSALDWPIPNKLFDLSSHLFAKLAISSYTNAEIIFSPHLNILTKGKLARVLTVHDLSFLHYPQFFSRRQRIWHWLQYWQKQIQEADHVIAVSEYTKADLIQALQVPEKKITVVYSGISPTFQPLEPGDPRILKCQKKYMFRAPYILYLGAIEKRKNLQLLVAAFNTLRADPRFKAHQLVIAGAPGYGGHEVLAAARCSSAASAIHFLSRVTDEDRIFLYNGAEAFVYPSFFEGFGFPPLEAQACGVPVIASNRTSLPELLNDSALFVDPWKPAELASALTGVLSDAELRAKLIQKGRANSARFRWEKTVTETLAIIARTHHAFYSK